MGLAYEIVINSNPCIAYLMEENSLTMQALVIAHAAYGHNSFFKGNYLFRTWTDAEAIVDYMVFAKNYIAECEQRHGIDAVETAARFLPCAAELWRGPLQAAGQAVDGAGKRAPEGARGISADRRSTTCGARCRAREEDAAPTAPQPRFPPEPEENLLYFIEKYAPLLEPWQREMVRITRKISQYFYPQRQTQVMNEGWATFWHYTILQPAV